MILWWKGASLHHGAAEVLFVCVFVDPLVSFVGFVGFLLVCVGFFVGLSTHKECWNAFSILSEGLHPIYIWVGIQWLLW